MNKELFHGITPPSLIYEEDGFSIDSGMESTILDTSKLASSITESIDKMAVALNIEDIDAYKSPLSNDINSYSHVKKILNSYLGITITLTFGDESVIIDKDQIKDWLSLDKDLNIVFDKEKIKDFVKDFSLTYETMGQSRDFINSYDKEIVVSGGDYGYWVDITEEIDTIINNIKSCQDVTREACYLQKSAGYGDSELGDSYIEISLTDQHLFAYNQGQLITDCDIISGLNTSSKKTPSGIYRMRFMMTNYTFNRSNFNRTVSYWMVFWGSSPETNVGIISCDWRNDFGGSTYLSSGTDGSILINMDSSKIIYNELPNDIPVIIY